MQWHFEDIAAVMYSLPHALHDLVRHEDKALVEKGLKAIAFSGSPQVSIEKTLDPIAQRSAQNIGLLLHDYINQLPSFDVSHSEGEELLEHWRKIMLEQPQRLAYAKNVHWHDEQSRAFWHDKVADHHNEFGITPDNFPDAWDDWQRAAGTLHATSNLKQLPAMTHKQWQDLIIRARLHKETMQRWHEG